MSFAKLYQKSNSSIHQLRGNVLECSIEQIRGNKVVVDTGLRPSFVCFQSELCEPLSASYFSQHSGQIAGSDKPDLLKQARGMTTGDRGCLQATRLADQSQRPTIGGAIVRPIRGHLSEGAKRVDDISWLPASPALRAASGYQESAAKTWALRPFQATCVIGVEDVQYLHGEPNCSAPKSWQKISRRRRVWTELTKLWRCGPKTRILSQGAPKAAKRGRLQGFILNSVNGGYAVAIAGYIAFLPRSLCLDKKVFHGQWRQVAIISMNPKIANIVVKEERLAPASSRVLRASVGRRLGGTPATYPFSRRGY